MKTTGHLFVVFDALNIVKGIKTIGGSENQTYYIESKKFVPDRRITPLIWQPYIYVTDPNGIIPFGDKVKELASSAWYISSIEPSNRVTAKEDTATIDTPFAVDSNNALHVRKNTDKPIQVFFEASYLDTRKDKVVHISLSTVISGTSNSEEKPAPKLSLSKPQSWKYSPFENVEKEEVEAKLSQDGQLLSGAVEWCKVEGDVETPLSEKDAFYLGGQNSDKLKVNPSLMPSTLLRARNIPESEYNRLYGINPEWDGRMSEVMENRNLIIRKGELVGMMVGLDGKVSTYAVSSLMKDKIPCKVGDKFSFNIIQPQNGGDNYFRYAYYSIDDKVLRREAKGGKFTDTAPNGTAYMLVSYPKSGVVKLEKGVVNTSYTPAPEDLNYRNLIMNGDLKKQVNGLAENFKPSLDSNVWIEDNYQFFEAKYKYGGVMYTPEIGDDISIYYIKFDYTALNNNMFFKIVNNDWQINLKHELTTYSSRTILKVGNQKPLLWFDGSSKSEYGQFGVKNLLVINLTAKFGAGNEPSKEICDEIFEHYGYIPAPEDLAPDGIIKGEYQSDIKFTRYLPFLDTSIEFLTGDTLRAGMTSVKMKAVVKTNKELISTPSKYFDIKWYLEPTSAGAKEEFLGSGEVIEVPVSKIDVKGGRFIPFRFDLKEKLL